MRINELMNELSLELAPYLHNSRAVVRSLLASRLGIEAKAVLALKSDTMVDEAIAGELRLQAGRLAAGEPLEYVLGECWFYGYRFLVGEGVLIPRPDTEVLVEEAFVACETIERPRILELCTGSACISISLLLELQRQKKEAFALATDISESAMHFALLNREEHQLEKTLELCLCDLFPEEKSKFDLLLSNPPYIDEEDMNMLDESVKDYEPHLALAGGADGLDYYRRIYTEAPRYLRPGSWIICEHGYRQAEAVSDIIRNMACYDQIDLRLDYANRSRVTSCRYMPTNSHE